MRIQPWMKAVAGAAMLLASQSPLSGQTPDAGGPYNDGMSPGGYGGGYDFYPAPGPAGGYTDPQTIYPQGIPEGYQPWPQISPFHPGNVGQEQHYNRGGLWFRELLYRQRTVEGSIEAIALIYKNAGDAAIGSPSDGFMGLNGSISSPDGVPVPPYAGTYPSPTTSTPPPLGWYTVTPLVFPFPALHTDASTYVTNSTRLYPNFNTRVMGSPGTDAGIRGRLGYFNEDDSGVAVVGWWGGEGTSSFSRGDEFINGIRVNQSLTSALGGQNLTPVNGNIPLYNGQNTIGPNFGLGSTAKYDVYYGVKATTQAAGANVNIYQQSIYRGDAMKLRPMWGIRYQYIGETFDFRGVDSGFTYQVNGATTTGGTGGGTGSTATASTGRPVATSLTRLYDQYTASLHNSVESHIAGPEIGFRFDLGQQRGGFKVWGETSIGISANSEEINLYGNNIGDPLYDARFGGYAVPRMLDPAFVSEFNSSRNSTHVSPVFQQSVYADIDVVDVVPVLRKMSAFENATFRIGYTFLWVGEVARPSESINWQGFPLYPEINIDRSSWWANQFNFGFNWTF
ncbi:hypothetical protein [Planctomicrobium sp. SH527]|uniref:hypothetical protein n=1 Tax=Planctomicrobium sp. SH527 TaxID=3448123 RepID=UPI003F5CABF1